MCVYCKMLNSVFCIICCFVIVSCYGKPVAEPQEVPPRNLSTARASQETLEKLYSLLNESLLMETLAGYPKREVAAAAPLSNQVELFTSPPFMDEALKHKVPQKATPQISIADSTLPLKASSDSDNATPQGQPLLADPGSTQSSVEDRLKEVASQTSSTTSTKSPLEYKPQRPAFATELSGGHLGQLIPPGAPWPASPTVVNNTRVEDRLSETTLDASSTTKSPLEYNPQKPSFAGSFSSGFLGQLIPPGKPWPADSSTVNTSVEDRLSETSSGPLQDASSTTKSPLEYKPQRPAFATELSGGHLGQLVPPGKPWPADPPTVNNTKVEDRFSETTLGALQDVPSTTKSPLEYNPQKPSFAGSFSSGHLGQLIPPGAPWPADPPNLQDRLKETTFKPSPTATTPQKPAFAGGFPSGQLIPPGAPWPASDPNLVPNLQSTTTNKPHKCSCKFCHQGSSTSKKLYPTEPSRITENVQLPESQFEAQRPFGSQSWPVASGDDIAIYKVQKPFFTGHFPGTFWFVPPIPYFDIERIN